MRTDDKDKQDDPLAKLNDGLRFQIGGTWDLSKMWKEPSDRDRYREGWDRIFGKKEQGHLPVEGEQ